MFIESTFCSYGETQNTLVSPTKALMVEVFFCSQNTNEIMNEMRIFTLEKIEQKLIACHVLQHKSDAIKSTSLKLMNYKWSVKIKYLSVCNHSDLDLALWSYHVYNSRTVIFFFSSRSIEKSQKTAKFAAKLFFSVIATNCSSWVLFGPFVNAFDLESLEFKQRVAILS